MANVLIADDDPVFCEMTRDLLSAAGHKVTVANNGREALECAQLYQFDLAVIDIHMPELDGLELILEIRQTIPALRIIAVTAGSPRGHGDHLQTARVFGAHAALRKPIVSHELIDLANRLGGGRKNHSDFRPVGATHQAGL